MTKERGACTVLFAPFSVPYRGDYMDHEEEIDDEENSDEEDLRRFLRGGIGAK